MTSPPHLLVLLADSDPERARKEATEALRAAFRPEFLNRVDDIVLFNPLGRAQLEKIVDLQLVRKLRLGRGIVLFHDTKAQTAAMLPAFLRALKSRGYAVVHVVPIEPCV